MILNKAMDRVSVASRTMFSSAVRAASRGIGLDAMKQAVRDAVQEGLAAGLAPRQGYELNGFFYSTPSWRAAEQRAAELEQLHYQIKDRHASQIAAAELIDRITPPPVPMSAFAPAAAVERYALSPITGTPFNRGATPIPGTPFIRTPDGRMVYTLARF